MSRTQRLGNHSAFLGCLTLLAPQLIVRAEATIGQEAPALIQDMVSRHICPTEQVTTNRKGRLPLPPHTPNAAMPLALPRLLLTRHPEQLTNHAREPGSFLLVPRGSAHGLSRHSQEERSSPARPGDLDHLLWTVLHQQILLDAHEKHNAKKSGNIKYIQPSFPPAS